jgi:hypothetical protein
MRLWLLLLPALTLANEIPAGTEISIRLTSSVSTRTSRTSDPVEAVVIAPVLTSLPAGVTVRGKVERIVQPAAGTRAGLLLRFHEVVIEGKSRPMAAQVIAVDNAREKVDEHGEINGILAAETITGKLDAGIDKLSDEYSGLASVLSAAKRAFLQDAATDISYARGVEMALRLAKPLSVPSTPVPALPAWTPASRALLNELIAREPFQTMAENPPRPSDITNLLLVSTEDTLRRAFTDAGWSGAAALNPLSKFETLRALAEDRGYSEAPVSILLLDGKPPDLVFQKLNNTFALRHHLRIWRRPGTVDGKPVWAIAATHDSGISFSEADSTFIHRIDSEIDREREKVVNDLLFTGRVKAVDLFTRSEVPHDTRNATGDSIRTDSRIAILSLD